MKKHKFIILTLIISILCIGLIFIISKNNKSIAVSYGIGDVVYINGDRKSTRLNSSHQR